jgi:phage shock protein C
MIEKERNYMTRKLYRSKRNKVISGVCGGIAEYFGLDPIIIRIAWVAIALAGGAGFIAYIIALIIIPEESSSCNSFNESRYDQHNGNETTDRSSETSDEIHEDTSGFNPSEWREQPKHDNEKGKYILGAILILVGLMFMIKQLFSWFDMRYFWPFVIIVLGVALLYKGRKKL